MKTEYSYNEDDFVQNRDGMQELTVTITLCEYRNLVKDLSHQDSTIERLEEENKRLKEQNKTYQKYIVANRPELIEKLSDFANALISIPTVDHPTEKGGGSDA